MAASWLFPKYIFKSLTNTRNFSIGETLYNRPKGYWGPKRKDGDVVLHRTTLYRQTKTQYAPGLNVGAGRGGHLFAITPGKVVITTEKTNFNLDAHILTCRCENPENIPYMKYYNSINMALRLPPPQRTQGDGMENEPPVEYTVVLSPQEIPEEVQPDCHDKNKNTAHKLKSPGAVIKLTPQTVNKKKKNVLVNLKNKEPKFVPYEPYKAAVKPIVPSQKSNFLRGRKNSKNLPVIFGSKDKSIVEDDEEKKETKKEEKEVEINWERKAKSLEGENHTLKEENRQLENQLKFQVQVNGELKNLLVAAVGEDMETKVHVLTEDKLHLARALLNSAKSLSTHQEQTEWLAGQCEVWRSKFLASSVMVEELARWKASLCQKVNETQEVVKKLIEERKQIRENLIKAHSNLGSLRDNFDLLNKRSNLKTSNVLDLSSELHKISQILVVQLLGTDGQLSNSVEPYNSLPGQTAAEKAAEHLLANPHLLQLIGEPDAACNAVVGAAVALNSQLYLQSHPPNIACCPQCSGEIKLV